MPTPVVKLEQLNISFGQKQVLHDFSLTIYPGQSLAVVGETGSGKSVGALLSMGLLDSKAKIQANGSRTCLDHKQPLGALVCVL